jgi:hypothetical protein
MKKHSVLNSPTIRKVKRKMRKAFLLKASLVFLIFIALFVGAIFLSRWKKINIQEIKVSGIQASDADEVKTAVEQELSGYYLHFFPKTNILLFPSRKIQNKLAVEFKRFKDISLKISGTETLSVSLSERKGSYLWCGDQFIPVATEKCYFMDDTGYIFEEAPYFSGNVYFKFFGKFASDESDPLGVSYLPGLFGKLISFKNTLDNIGITSFALQGMDTGDMEFFLYSPSSSKALPPAIIFNSDADFTKLLENLQTAITTEPLQTDFQKNYASMKYIDLRFGNRVYYKFR